MQNSSKKKFIPIWEKLGKIESRGRNDTRQEGDQEKRKIELRSKIKKSDFESSDDKPRPKVYHNKPSVKINQISIDNLSEEEEEYIDKNNEDGGIVD